MTPESAGGIAGLSTAQVALQNIGFLEWILTVRLWLSLQKKVVSAARAKKADITGPDDSAVAAKAEVVEEVKEKVLGLPSAKTLNPKSKSKP